jgi:hypothetical protein
MKIYAVHTLSWLLDECETELFANKSDALETFNALLASYHDGITATYIAKAKTISTSKVSTMSNIKILIQEIIVQ